MPEVLGNRICEWSIFNVFDQAVENRVKQAPFRFIESNHEAQDGKEE
jgi:hypothetical protein